MSLWKHYHLAKSVPDALQALAMAAGPARLIAGGTDLILDVSQGRHPPVHTFVDVTSIPEMNVIEVRQGRLFIGAGVPLNRIVDSRLVREHAQALVESCGLIGGPQVRNTATLGGNVAHALPAADGSIALLALEAQAEVANRDGRRLVPIGEMYTGPGHSVLIPDREVLVGFYLPLREPLQASAFQRIMRPQGVALPILNMGVWLSRRQDIITDVRIALGPAGPVPRRASTAESVLRNSAFNAENIAAALKALLQETSFRSSPHRATADYRRQMAGVLLESVLRTAWRRAGGEVNSKVSNDECT